MKTQKALKKLAFFIIGLVLIASMPVYAQQPAVLALDLEITPETNVNIGDVLSVSGTLTYVSGPATLDEVTINYYVGLNPNVISISFTDELINILTPGDVISYTHQIEVQEPLFTSGANNIVVVWPTTGLANDDNEEVRKSVEVNDIDLSVELIAFGGNYNNNNQVKLSWVIGTEGVNSDFFQVERSQDGINYDACGIVEGWDFKVVEGVYEFEDKNPFFLKTYYRLHIVGASGASDYSTTLIVERPEDNMLKVDNLYINSAAQQVDVIFSASDNSPLTLAIYDVKGALVYKEEITDVQVGFNERTVDVHPLTFGLHVLTLYNGSSKLVSEKFVKR